MCHEAAIEKIDNKEEVEYILSKIYKSPRDEWESALNIKRPKFWQFFKRRKFFKAIALTKSIIALTLKLKTYNTDSVPRVDCFYDSEEGVWSLTVHTWGPWEKVIIWKDSL